MKKYICYILAMCIVLAFAGCSQDPIDTQPSSSVQTTPTEAPTVATIPPETAIPQDSTIEYDAPMAAVALPLIIQAQTADDGKEIAYYTHQDVYITLPDADVAQIITLDLLNRIDQTNTAAEAILSTAKNNYNGQEDWSAYAYTVSYQPVRIDENILSFLGTEMTHDGSPRSSHTSIAVSYDLTTGESLTLKTIFHEENFADALCDMIIAGLDAQADGLYADYADIVKDMFAVNTPIINWYFSENGLCFFFSPYEIAPYTAGTIISEIPYEKLSGLLKDAYFPGEQFSYSGAIHVSALDNTGVPETLSQFAELKLDNSGEKLLLTTDGSVSNIVIKYHAGTTEYDEDAVVLRMAGMGPSDAIILELKAEVATERIQVCYESQGENLTLTLLQNEDGTWTLTK